MSRPHRTSGFTLVELLAVLVVIAILGFLIGPAIVSSLRGSEMTRGGQLVVDEINLARQTSLTQNVAVEVRFYRAAKAGMPGEITGDPSTGKFRGLQSFSFDASGKASPIDMPRWLPGTLIMDSGGALSSLLAASQVKSWSTLDPQISLPVIGTAYVACAFQFQPDGSTNLTPAVTQQWFVTLHDALKGDNLAGMPTNFWTLQVDPLNGHVKSYRP